MTENYDNSTSPLLINESPLQVLPRLAVAIGLNEAIVLQQIHYWLRKQSEVKEGKKWVYNTYEDWQKQFPYLKMATIRRTFKSLEKQGLLITGNFNKYSFDKTKWYSIDYEKLDSLSRRCAQIEQTDCSNSTHATAQNEHTNTIRLPETTTENNDDMSGKPDASSSKSNYPERT
ncbi:hypothetical protein Q757_05875 [Oenococcus alcoholitolerans]|uniref:Replication protein n=1 Tax=Oenococcus alcoholitolerans TaxID=931074 RepID=A0ABR4XQB6_9LACO|nr:hypothetical protein Q757_05875 [Oenococcus alcoholitolerans]